MVYPVSSATAIEQHAAAKGRVEESGRSASLEPGIYRVAATTSGAAQGMAKRLQLSGCVAAVVLLLAAPPSPSRAQDASVEEGAEVFKKCRACHDVGPEAKNKVGPLLNGIIGRKAGTIDGFAYSEANKASGVKGLVWTEDVLFKYLENPLTFMPGTKMAFAGLKDPQDRKDLIAYLKTFSK
jgi:cytochrome c